MPHYKVMLIEGTNNPVFERKGNTNWARATLNSEGNLIISRWGPRKLKFTTSDCSPREYKEIRSFVVEREHLPKDVETATTFTIKMQVGFEAPVFLLLTRIT